MNAYMKVFNVSTEHKLRIFPTVNKVSWRQANILHRLNSLFEEHFLDRAASQPSDFFLHKLVQGMLCTNVVQAKFTYENSENQTYIDMVSSGLISGGINVSIQLVNDSIIMAFDVNELDVTAEQPLVVYIQAVPADREVLPTVPDIDTVANDLSLLGVFFAMRLIEINRAAHEYDYGDLVLSGCALRHYVKIFDELGIDPLKYMANAKLASGLLGTIEAIYSNMSVDTGLYVHNYNVVRNSEGEWEISLGDVECVVHTVTISEPELLIHFHPNGYQISRLIALKTAAKTIHPDARLCKSDE